MINFFSKSTKPDDFAKTHMGANAQSFAETLVSVSDRDGPPTILLHDWSDSFSETLISQSEEDLKDIPTQVRKSTEAVLAHEPTGIESQVPKNIYSLFYDPLFPKITPYLTYILEQKSMNAKKDDYTALETALYNGYTPVVDFLLSHFDEVLINRRDLYGSTPLKKAFLGLNIATMSDLDNHYAAIDTILNNKRLDILAHNQWETILKDRKNIKQYKAPEFFYTRIEELIKTAQAQWVQTSSWRAKIRKILGF